METEISSVSSLVPSFGFSADRMGTEENIAAWRAAVSTFFDVDELAAGDAQPFRADLRSYAMGNVVFGQARASGQHFRRDTRTMARSGVDHVIIQAYLHGGGSPLTALLTNHLHSRLDHAPRMSLEEGQSVVEGTVELV